LSALPFLGACAAQAPETVVLGTNEQGSLFYVLGVGLADVLGKHMPMTVEMAPTGAAVFLPMFETKEVDFALLTIDELYAAYVGAGQYNEPTQGKGYDMYTLLVGGPLQIAMMTRGDSPINSLKDLRGKRVGMMKILYSGQLSTLGSLANAGLDPSEVNLVEVTSLADATDALIEGRLDASAMALGNPQTKRLLATANGKTLPLDPSPQAMARMQKVFPGYYATKAPPALTGLEKADYVLTKDILVASRPGLSQNVVSAILEVMWNNYQELAPVHPRFKSWRPEIYASTHAVIPYSKEAVKFYKAKGVWTDELDQHQKAISK
jgi:hypothetical protein